MAAASRALMYPYDISLLHMIMHKFPDFEIIEVASPNGWGYVGKDAGSKIGIETGIIVKHELKRAGFLSERHWTKIEHPATKMLDRYLHSSVESITLQVTQQCNLKCNYCPYSGSYYNREHSNRHMSFETAKQQMY